MLVLLPIVAAVTKAYAEGKINWIKKMRSLLYCLAGVAFVIQILLAVFLQPIVNFWLVDKAITVNYSVAAVFVFASIVGMWVSVQSAIVTGLNRLNLQLVFFLLAVPFKILLIVIGSRNGASWVIVVLATGLCLLPYGIVQPFAIEKLLSHPESK
jgi:O-antigen/teichoic acid export membrane protein